MMLFIYGIFAGVAAARAGSDSAIVPTIARVVRLCTVNWRVEGHSLTRTPPPCGQRALHHPMTCEAENVKRLAIVYMAVSLRPDAWPDRRGGLRANSRDRRRP
jgi:hypothetical protein